MHILEYMPFEMHIKKIIQILFISKQSVSKVSSFIFHKKTPSLCISEILAKVIYERILIKIYIKNAIIKV